MPPFDYKYNPSKPTETKGFLYGLSVGVVVGFAILALAVALIVNALGPMYP